MEETDVISWSKDYFLKWSDFTADPNHTAFEDASCQIKYNPTWTVYSEMIDGKIFYMIDKIHLTTIFLRHLSWVRKIHSSDSLLNHQQGHFDYAEFLRPTIVENLETEFGEKKFPTRGQNEEQRKQHAREDSGRVIAKQLEKWNKILLDYRNQYDKETEYGQNQEKQKEYDEKFQKLRKNN